MVGVSRVCSLVTAPPSEMVSNEEMAHSALQLFHKGEFEQALNVAIPLKGDLNFGSEMTHLVAASLHQLGRSEEAVVEVRRAIRDKPDNAAYLNTYGVILRKLNRLEQAIRSYECVIALMPEFTDVYYNCGNALSELERQEEAIERFKRCLVLNPKHHSAHHNLANCYRDQKDLDLALDHYSQSASIEHFNPDMHCNWGLTWQLKERWEKAIECFETAISQKSDHAPSHINLGSALAVQHRFEEACGMLRRGVELDDSCNDAKFNLGLTLLTIGEMEEGWHFYDTRLRLPDKVRPPLPTPMWDGKIASLNGEPLLVWAEQGFGDNIQFARYVQILQKAGVKVTLSTRAPLMKLLRECLYPDTPAIVEHKPPDLQAFNHHIALLSLPRLCNTTLETIPVMPGYLREPSISRCPKNLKINRHPFALHIGLVWASGVDNKDMYEDKSMKLEPIMKLLEPWREKQLVVIHSLQVGVDAKQLEPWLDCEGVFDHANDLNDFFDTASLISQLDLVLSVDTAVAHVAGAMNKPIWTMLQHNADFRWLRGRSDTPWYPSMSLLRQKSLGDWNSVIDLARLRLMQLLG